MPAAQPTPNPQPGTPPTPPTGDDEVQTGVPDNVLLPAALDKALAYLTDRGTLIRIGVGAIGAVLVLSGLFLLFSDQTIKYGGKALKAVI